MKTLNILHVYKSYYPETQGGVERLIQMLSQTTIKMGCKNRLLTCTNQKKAWTEKTPELEVFFYPKTLELASSPFSYALWKAFPEHAAWADIIHYHFPWPMADILHCTRNIKKPCLITYHSDVVRQKYLRYLYQPLMHRFLSQMDFIVSTSQNYVNTSEILKNYTQKILVIPIGIDENFYTASQEKQQIWQKKLREQHIDSFILFVGVLRYYKGLAYLLDALDDTGVTLIIAGDGPMMHQLKTQAEQLKNVNIIFTGFLDDKNIAALYNLANMLVIPASHRSEAYCIALVEGLMFGLPLISTELGTGTSFVNQHEKTGFVVPARDSDALKQAIKKLLLDETLQKKMRLASRKRFEEFFTAEMMAKKYCELYRKSDISSSSIGKTQF